MTPRRGFSLIELVLAIGLSIALVALLGFAIDLHLVRLDSSRSAIEEAQLARALLEQITKDLRAATTAPSQDVSALMSAAESASQFNVDEVDQNSADSGAASSASEEQPPGLYGLPNSLTVDTRQIGRTLSTPTEGGPPILRVDGGWLRVVYSLSMAPESPGLIRTITPHDSARWRDEQGQPAPIGTPIAPEVRGLQFAYFDGSQQFESWDMVEQESLPLAVEVRLQIAPPDAVDENDNVASGRLKTYRRVVRLTAAQDESGGSGGASEAASGSETL